MSVKISTILNPSQKVQIQSMDPNFPVDDVDFFVFYETEGRICSAAALIREDDETYECYAFTTPDKRRQGMFSELLNAAIDELPEDTGLIFYTNRKDSNTEAALNAMEAELIMEEHMMEIDLSNFAAYCPHPSDVSALPLLTMTKTVLDGTKTRQYQNPYGMVNISVFSGYYYLYGLEIQENKRGRGHGTDLLTQVLHDLARHNPLPLRLQVSGENAPALSLYKKTGFQITETLFGYYY